MAYRDENDAGDEDPAERAKRAGGAAPWNHFRSGSPLPSGLRDLAAVVEACRHMLDGPDDLPVAAVAFGGLALSLVHLDKDLHGAGMIAASVGDALGDAQAREAVGATILSLSRRTGRHLLYALAIQVGQAFKAGAQMDPVALEVLGAWCLRRNFDAWMPTPRAIAKVGAALVRPTSVHARAWTAKARARALTLALHNLNQAIEAHPATAIAWGLAVAAPWVVQTLTPIEEFARRFRRRGENLRDFATLDAVAAAGGYDTLSTHGLLDAGRALMNRVRSGDKAAALVCLEIISHLPCETVLRLPIQFADAPPEGALAWLNLRAGDYCHSVYRMIDRDARPEPGTEHLYEVTTQVVTVHLSPPLWSLLAAEWERSAGTAASVGVLLGEVGHHPRAAVVDQGAYRCTARRLQESVPALLLQAGHHRWPVALAFNCHFLVARGRYAYGVCRATAIDEVVDAGYRLLDWPPPAGRPSNQDLVGSFTTPRAGTVTAALNAVAAQADASMPLACDFAGTVAMLNRHAEWVALLLALALALRKWVHYALRADQLRAGGAVDFDDKAVHQHQGPPIPMARLLSRALQGWFALCESTVTRLRGLGDRRSVELADRIEPRLKDVSSIEAVFTVDAADRLEPVGHHTWTAAVPQHIALRPAFGRQFWPLQLMDRRIEQLLMDILMRHQLDGLHPGSSNSMLQLDEATKRLRDAMDEILQSLGLRLPGALDGA